jgi:ABC-type branched-subunit amino acid transport system substrate-binding protein
MTVRAVLLLVLFVGACKGGGPTTAGGGITFGAMLSETGTLGSGGQLELLAIRQAADEVNAAGGVLGTTISVVERNDNGDPMNAPALARELVDQLHVPAILGGITSDITIAISSVTIPAQVVLISGDATAPSISTLAKDDLVFRTIGTDVQQGRLISERARTRGFTRVAVIYEPGTYGTGLSGAFAESFSQSGGTVTDAVAFLYGQPNYRDVLSLVYEKQPEAILLVAFPVEGAQVVKDYVLAFEFHQTFWFFSDGMQDQSFVTAIGASNITFAHEGTGPGTSVDGFPIFEQAHRAKYGREPEFFAANNYDSFYLLALAAVQAGRADGTALRDNLRKVANPPGMKFGPGQFAEAAAAIQAGVKVNYEGASGPVDLDANGDPTPTYSLWQVSGGAIVITARGLSP